MCSFNVIEDSDLSARLIDISKRKTLSGSDSSSRTYRTESLRRCRFNENRRKNADFSSSSSSRGRVCVLLYLCSFIFHLTVTFLPLLTPLGEYSTLSSLNDNVFKRANVFGRRLGAARRRSDNKQSILYPSACRMQRFSLGREESRKGLAYLSPRQPAFLANIELFEFTANAERRK